jgi:glutathione S-transferase
MIRVETTPGCPGTLRILMALEEVGIAYDVEMRDPGYFAKTYNLSGPRVEDDAVVLFEPNAILRYLMRVHAPAGFGPHDAREWAVVDQWMDFAISRVGPAVTLIVQHRRGAPEAQDRSVVEAQSHTLLRALAALDAFLAPRSYLLGRFTLADCVFIALEALPMTEIPIDHFSAVQDYVARLLQRPAYDRAVRARDAA